jgi:glycosyltransferase involved in cell wall biosynthesis
MNTDEKKISVIIPVYNCERYLAESIESVKSQTYSPYEIIVIDDGSTDKSAQVAESFGSSIKYHFQSHAGIGSARNNGIRLSSGDMIAFLDADDLWEENKLMLQVEAFHEEPTTDMVLGYVEHFYSPELDETFKRSVRCPAKAMPGFLPSVVLVKKNTFDKVGLFDTNWRSGEFISWYSRFKDLGFSTKMLPDTITYRRLHPTSHGVRCHEGVNDYAHIIKSLLDRRRLLK